MRPATYLHFLAQISAVATALLFAVPAMAAQYVNVNAVPGVPPVGSSGMISSCTGAAPNAGRGITFDCSSWPTQWIIGAGGNIDCWQGAAPTCAAIGDANDVFMCDGLSQTLASHCVCAPNMISCGGNCQ